MNYMRDFFITFYNNGIVIFLYITFLILIASFKLKKAIINKNVFTCENLFLAFFYVFIAVGPIIGILVKNYE